MDVPAHDGKRPPFALASYGAAGSSWPQEDDSWRKPSRHLEKDRAPSRIFCSVLSPAHPVLFLRPWTPDTLFS